MACKYMWPLILLPCVQLCTLSLHQSNSENATRLFYNYIGRDDVNVVFMDIYIHRPGADLVYDLYQVDGMNDTFLSWKWVWASGEGAFILRMPLDYQVMSLGVLAATTRTIDILLDDEPQGCSTGDDVEDINHQIAQILVTNVTENVGYSSNGYAEDGGGVCRSANTNSHLSDVRKLIGYKCCAWNKDEGAWVCDLDYMDGWMTTWFGPLMMVGWLYVILLAKAVSECRQIKKSSSVSGTKIIEHLKLSVIKEVSQVTDKVPIANKPSELISQHEDIRLMDVVAISRKTQFHIARAMKITLAILFFLGYYGYVAGSLYYYKMTELEIYQMHSDAEVSLNVFSHIAWIFADPALTIKYYAMVELAITCLIPILVLIIYAYQRTKYQNDSKPTPSPKVQPVDIPSSSSQVPKLPPIVPEQQKELTFSDAVIQKSYQNKTCLGRCLHSKPGRVLNVVCCIVVLLYGLCIASVHVAYMSYFLLKGALLSMTVLATWLLPAGLMYQYIKSVFYPLLTLYTHTQQRFFELIVVEAAHLVETKDDVAFIQRSLLEGFYQMQVRRKVFKCVQQAMVAVTALILLFIVLFSSGSSALQKNSSSILGVNLALILPILGKAMEEKPIPELERRSIDRAIRDYIKLKGTVKKQWKGIQSMSLKKNNAFEKLKAGEKAFQPTDSKPKAEKDQKERKTSREKEPTTRGSSYKTDPSPDDNVDPKEIDNLEKDDDPDDDPKEPDTDKMKGLVGNVGDKFKQFSQGIPGLSKLPFGNVMNTNDEEDDDESLV